jgi:hypothetical protein
MLHRADRAAFLWKFVVEAVFFKAVGVHVFVFQNPTDFFELLGLRHLGEVFAGIARFDDTLDEPANLIIGQIANNVIFTEFVTIFTVCETYF